jgi:hypothetical protein
VLKNKVNRLKRDITGLFPNHQALSEEHQNRNYTLSDWSIEDIRKVVFPEGRECFDSADESLMEKWNDTNWLDKDLLKLFSVEELKVLRDWLEERDRKRGLTNA